MTRPQLTNRLGLPEPLVRAVSRDPYNPGDCDISVIRLVAPARKVALEYLHRDEIVEDAADRIFALLGQIGHLILERAADENIREKRYFATVLGWKVSGQVDLIPDGIIDYKLTSIYAVKDGLKPEWLHQVNLLAYLCAQNGVTVTKGQIIVIFRDWFLSKSRRDPAYPQSQVQVLDVPIWTADQQRVFILERVDAHQQARKTLPDCTTEETWNGKRCADWCGAYPWCSQANPNLAPGNPKPNSVRQPCENNRVKGAD